jgi:NDP-sugar pyrophosphorylase family protein
MKKIQSLDAIILVGGKGTRLQSVVKDRPKPMAEVAGKPFAERLVVMLRTQGINRVVFGTGYMGDVVKDYFGDGRQLDMEITYSCDPTPLGTGGAIRYALNQIQSDRFLVLNGDSYCPIQLDRLIEMHVSRHAKATLWLIPMSDCGRFGRVEVDQDHAVLAFIEKSSEKLAGLINAGVYLLEREAAKNIPAGRAVSLETEFFPGLVGKGLFAIAGTGPFLDIGTPESYATAERFFA